MKLPIHALFIIVLCAFSSVTAQQQQQQQQKKPPTEAKPDNAPQTAAVALAEAILRVEVENGKTVILTAKDLTKFARRSVKAKGHDEKESVYAGVSLRDVLADANAKIGAGELRGKELAAYLVVEAADGYRATFAVAELSADFTDRLILLADTRDGVPLDEKNGKWQIIVPGEKKHGRWVRQVTALKIKRA